MSNRWRQIAILILRIILGVIFIYSAIGKILDPAQFAHDIAAYRLLPIPMVNIFALILPFIELISGLGLIVGIWLDATSAITSVLVSIFIIAALSAMARGLNIECGCFTLSSNGKVGWDLITRDVLMLIGAVAVFIHSSCRRSDQSELKT